MPPPWPAAVMMAEKGPTGFPIMERRNSQAILWDLGRVLAVRLETLAPLMRDLKVKVGRMCELAGADWAQVSDLAAALAARRVSIGATLTRSSVCSCAEISPRASDQTRRHRPRWTKRPVNLASPRRAFRRTSFPMP